MGTVSLAAIAVKTFYICKNLITNVAYHVALHLYSLAFYNYACMYCVICESNSAEFQINLFIIIKIVKLYMNIVVLIQEER